MDEAFVATLRSRLKEVEAELARLHALRQEHASLQALLKVYEQRASGIVLIPEPGQSEEARAEWTTSFPRLMTIAVRHLLLTDIGPTNTVPGVYFALPDSLRQQFSGKDDRSNIETLRTQITTWKDDFDLTYERGGVVGLRLGPNGERPKSFFRAGSVVLRSGIYECALHPTWREKFEQGSAFKRCPFGGADCAFEFAEPLAMLQPPQPEQKPA